MYNLKQLIQSVNFQHDPGRFLNQLMKIWENTDLNSFFRAGCKIILKFSVDRVFLWKNIYDKWYFRQEERSSSLLSDVFLFETPPPPSQLKSLNPSLSLFTLITSFDIDRRHLSSFWLAILPVNIIGYRALPSPVADLKGGTRDAPPSQNFFIFMQFLGEIREKLVNY